MKSSRNVHLFMQSALALSLLLLHLAYGQKSVGFQLQLADTFPPAINLSSPINNSASLNSNPSFFYNVSDSSDMRNCSLLINDRINLTNTSVTKNTRLRFKVNNVPIGIYNWSVNCTDILNNSGLSARSLFTVHSLNFNSSTTNLSLVDNRYVTDFMVESSPYGRINFSSQTDLSVGYDFDSYINITSNVISVDSAYFGVLNKSAVLRLRGLTFSDPRILRDGSLCPSSICTRLTYSGGTLTFNVTQFSSYSAEETPSSSSTSSSSSGSGGGGSGSGGGGFMADPGSLKVASKVSTDFTIDKSSIKVVLRQGQSSEETIKIKNIGTTEFDIKAILSELEKFKVFPEGSELTTYLKPNEEKSIKFVFKADDNEIPEIYPGKILLKSPSNQKEIVTVIEVDSAQALFDVDAEVVPESKSILPGQEVLLDVTLVNIRGFGRVDVNVEYFIKDLKGIVVATEHETLAVETQAKFTRSILAPSDLLPGTYVALVKVTYGDSVGVSSDLFEVKVKTLSLYPIFRGRNFGVVFAAVVAILLLAGLGAYYFIRLRRKTPAPVARAKEKEQIISENANQKLKKELDALEKAYRSGFISEDSYQKSRKRIDKKLGKESQ